MAMLTNSDLIAAGSLVTAGCAVFISVWQAVISRRHNKLSVKPHIEAIVRTSDEDVQIEIENGGLGPAIVESIVVSVGKQHIQIKTQSDLYNIIGLLFSPCPPKDLRIASYVPGQYTSIAPGCKLTLLDIKYNKKSETLKEELIAQLFSSSITVRYRCMYEHSHEYREGLLHERPNHSFQRTASGGR